MDSERLESLRNEAALVRRGADYYQGRLERAIRALNHAPNPESERESLRMCVEIVHLLLTSQSRIAELIDRDDIPAARARSGSRSELKPRDGRQAA